MVPADPSRKNSPVGNQFAKPISVAQSLENAATAQDDSRWGKLKKNLSYMLPAYVLTD
jgi:hypothetical protein